MIDLGQFGSNRYLSWYAISTMGSHLSSVSGSFLTFQTFVENKRQHIFRAQKVWNTSQRSGRDLSQWVRPQVMVVSLTQEEQTTNILQSSRAECYLVADRCKGQKGQRGGISVVHAPSRWPHVTGEYGRHI